MELDQLNRTQHELKHGSEELEDILRKLEKEQVKICGGVWGWGLTPPPPPHRALSQAIIMPDWETLRGSLDAYTPVFQIYADIQSVQNSHNFTRSLSW